MDPPCTSFSKTTSQIQTTAAITYTEKGHRTFTAKHAAAKMLPLCMLLMQLLAPETFVLIRVGLRMQHTSSRFACSYWLDTKTDMDYSVKLAIHGSDNEGVVLFALAGARTVYSRAGLLFEISSAVSNNAAKVRRLEPTSKIYPTGRAHALPDPWPPWRGYALFEYRITTIYTLYKPHTLLHILSPCR